MRASNKIGDIRKRNNKKDNSLRLRKEAEVRHRAESEAHAQHASRGGILVASVLGISVLGAVGFWLVEWPAAPAPSRLSVLSQQQERAMGPKDTFKECTNCPEMIVVPAGTYTMGAPLTEVKDRTSERPQHSVTMLKLFAVGRYAVTFDQWDTCVAERGCSGYKPADEDWGRGRLPVINVSWGDDAKAYVAWLTTKTGKWHRLLSEAEWEYVTRAGTTTAYWWGNEIGTRNANCSDCGSYLARPAPVDS